MQGYRNRWCSQKRSYSL